MVGGPEPQPDGRPRSGPGDRPHPQPADKPGGGESRTRLPARRLGARPPGCDEPFAAAGGRGGSIRGGNGDFTSRPENRTVPPEICRPDRRLPSPLGERSDPALRLCPGLCERMGEGDLRQTASEVRRVPQPGLHSGVRRRHRTPSHHGKGSARGNRRRLRDGGLCATA